MHPHRRSWRPGSCCWTTLLRMEVEGVEPSISCLRGRRLPVWPHSRNSTQAGSGGSRTSRPPGRSPRSRASARLRAISQTDWRGRSAGRPSDRGARIRTWIDLLNREVTYRLAHTPQAILRSQGPAAGRPAATLLVERENEGRRAAGTKRPQGARSGRRRPSFSLSTRVAGFEPAISAVTRRCPGRWTTPPERAGGFEPPNSGFAGRTV